MNDAYAFLDACFGRETFATFAGDFECGIFPIMCVVCHTASWLRVAVEFSQPGLRGNADGQAVRHWTLTTLPKKLIKIGAKVVRHSRKIIFQMAEVAVPRELFQTILERIGRLRSPAAATG